ADDGTYVCAFLDLRRRRPALHAASWSAASSASSLGVFGLSLAFTSGVTPAPRLTPPPPRLRPLGRKYSPTVMSSAPPLDGGPISWKTPLPNGRVPTTSARWRSCSAPVTISEADALWSLTSTTTGMSVLIAPPVAL